VYNGWPNYETWLAALWLGNDPTSDADSHQLVGASRTTQDGADALQAYVEERSPRSEQASLYSDLLGAALRMVDWRRIAAHYRGDLR